MCTVNLVFCQSCCRKNASHNACPLKILFISKKVSGQCFGQSIWEGLSDPRDCVFSIVKIYVAWHHWISHLCFLHLLFF